MGEEQKGLKSRMNELFKLHKGSETFGLGLILVEECTKRTHKKKKRKERKIKKAASPEKNYRERCCLLPTQRG